MTILSTELVNTLAMLFFLEKILGRLTKKIINGRLIHADITDGDMLQEIKEKCYPKKYYNLHFTRTVEADQKLVDKNRIKYGFCIALLSFIKNKHSQIKSNCWLRFPITSNPNFIGFLYKFGFSSYGGSGYIQLKSLVEKESEIE